jgi:hypothetical protein
MILLKEDVELRMKWYGDNAGVHQSLTIFSESRSPDKSITRTFPFSNEPEEIVFLPLTLDTLDEKSNGFRQNGEVTVSLF